MTEGLVLAIVALIGLAVGVWAGLPGRDRPSAEDVDRAIDAGGGRPRRKRQKRSLNPLAWVQRKARAKPSRGRGGRKGFKLESPDDR